MEICGAWQLVGWIGVKRRTRDDLKIGGLVVSTEAAERLGRARRADLRVEITVNGGVILQKNELV